MSVSAEFTPWISTRIKTTTKQASEETPRKRKATAEEDKTSQVAEPAIKKTRSKKIEFFYEERIVKEVKFAEKAHVKEGSESPYSIEIPSSISSQEKTKPIEDRGFKEVTNGYRLERKGKIDEAIECYERAVALGNIDAEARLGHINIYEKHRLLDESIKQIKSSAYKGSAVGLGCLTHCYQAPGSGLKQDDAYIFRTLRDKLFETNEKNRLTDDAKKLRQEWLHHCQKLKISSMTDEKFKKIVMKFNQRL